MKTLLKIAVVATALVMMLLVDVPLPYVQLVPEAHAILGVRRRSFVVGASVGAATASAAAQSQQSAAAQQQAAAAQQQVAIAQQQAAIAQQQAAAAGKPLPLGTVVSTLPAGCTSTPVGGVEYYYCGGNFYRAVFQGNSLVYVTAKPE
jgi:hypothetical protein